MSYWVINGHLEDCAYLRSLDDLTEVDECDCDIDREGDDFWDEEDDLVS